MKVKAFSVRLSSLIKISDKAYKATAFDGSTAIIPISQVFGEDYEVIKSEAYWISEWILSKKDLQYSDKKKAWFDTESGKKLPTYQITKHIPDAVAPVNKEVNESLIR